MYLLIEDDNLLKKYNTTWGEVSADIRKEFDSKSFYNKKFLESEIKSYGYEVADFYGKEFLRWALIIPV